jgi:phosphoglycerol transferase MdoB-like AlkP superfamily enzyme
MHKTIKKWKLISEITSTFLFWGKCFFGIYLIHVFYRTIVFGILGSWELSINQIIEAVQNGFQQDLSAVAYQFIALILGFWLTKSLPIAIRFPLFATCFTIILIYSIIIWIADAAILYYWGTHINTQALSYLAYPKQLLNSVSISLIGFLVLGIFLGSFLIFTIILRWLRNIPKSIESLKGITPFSVLLLIVLLVLARGGIGKIPLTLTDPYRSDNEKVNILGVNAFWNVNYQLFSAPKYPEIAHLRGNDFLNIHLNEAYLSKKISLMDSIGNPRRLPPKNLVIILLEGISAQTSVLLGGTHYNGLTKLDSWSQKWGRGHANCYSTGDRTDKGLVSVFSGWPGQPWQGILHEPDRFKNLPHLMDVFSQKGFRTHFFYGGDVNFANMKAYMSGGGTQEIWDKTRLARNSKTGNWGVHDSDVLNQMYEVLAQQKDPYMASVLTLSSHEPYDVVKNQNLNELEKYYASVSYVDNSLDAFLKKCFTDHRFDETCFLVVSDHGKYLGTQETHFGQRDFFRIPFYLIGKSVNYQIPEIKANCFSQADIYNSIMDWYFNEIDTRAKYSRSIFRKEHPGNAIFHLYEVAGIIQKDRIDWISTNPKQIEAEKPLNLKDSAILSLETEIISDFFRLE